jgi:hypothetical protein
VPAAALSLVAEDHPGRRRGKTCRIVPSRGGRMSAPWEAGPDTEALLAPIRAWRNENGVESQGVGRWGKRSNPMGL